MLLNSNTNGSRFIKGYNADDFFRFMKIELGLDEPDIIRRPFTQLLNTIADIKPVIIDNKEVDLCSETRKQIEHAIKGFEEKEGFENKPEISKYQIEEDELLKKVKEIYNNADYAEIINYEPSIRNSHNTELIKYYSYVYLDWGYSIGEKALKKSSNEKEKLCLESIEKTKKAIEINPNYDLGYNNWGWMLGELASLKSEDDKEELYLESIEKSKKAIEINPDNALSHNNWGWILAELASLKSGKEKVNVLLESTEKFKKAIKINPEYELAYDNLGGALGDLALLKKGNEKKEFAFRNYKKL